MVRGAAQFIASHVLVLLGVGILMLGLAVFIVVALARAAARHKDLLWSAIDTFVPGRLWRPRTYLLGHLALGLVLALAALAFVAIAEEVVAGEELAAFDLALAMALRGETSPAWRTVFWYLTWLGSGWAVAVVAVIIVLALVRRRHMVLATMWGISQGGSAVLNYGMKLAFARPRPEGADPLLFASGWSFPSGHAMSTLVLCGIGAYLLARLAPSWAMRGPLILLLLVWPVLVGFSRLYLGVHYASDVIAGYLAGTVWVAICITGAEVALSRSRARLD
jgi:membrane-associated phospholipid phosphatase